MIADFNVKIGNHIQNNKERTSTGGRKHKRITGK